MQIIKNIKLGIIITIGIIIILTILFMFPPQIIINIVGFLMLLFFVTMITSIVTMDSYEHPYDKLMNWIKKDDEPDT